LFFRIAFSLKTIGISFLKQKKNNINMSQKAENLIQRWQKKNIQGVFCETRKDAVEKILEIIPLSGTIGISGSVTLDELQIVKQLEARGNRVYNAYKAGISREESLEVRKQGAQADYYLASANAVSEKGELVFFSAYGNRISGIASAKNAIIICGINKLTPDLESALKRAREYATPLNCKRLNWGSACFADGVCKEEDCSAPEYKRMCCQVLIIEAEAVPGRMTVILVGGNLGF
jgi:hypothetical protein